VLSAALAFLTFIQPLRFEAAEPTFYGDTSHINALAFDDQGVLWIATNGGLLESPPFGTGRKVLSFGWNGLIEGRGPDNVWVTSNTVYVSSAERVLRWNGEALVRDADAVPARQTSPLPTGSRGTHVSAAAGSLAAAYEEGVWQDQKLLTPPRGADFRHAVALAERDDRLAVATQEGHVWVREKRWTHLDLSDCPGSTYFLAEYNRQIITSSFDSGIRSFSGKWSAALPQSNPRHLAVYDRMLYVRQTTGEVDRFDGRRWKRNLLPWLLRGGAVSLATGDEKLLVGQYGGWSEFDGKRWSHFLRLPLLEGRFVTALAATKDTVWIGTQDRGIIRYDRKTHLLSNYDQRHGIEDDWVRCILADDKAPVIGMFLTGAYVKRGEVWNRLTPEVTGEATALARSPSGSLYVASREGLWRIEEGRANAVWIAGIKQLEVQGMTATKRGLWLGLPNGVAFVPWSKL
jgi:hypothetical protein